MRLPRFAPLLYGKAEENARFLPPLRLFPRFSLSLIRLFLRLLQPWVAVSEAKSREGSRREPCLSKFKGSPD